MPVLLSPGDVWPVVAPLVPCDARGSQDLHPSAITAFAVPELLRLARFSKATLDAYVFKGADRFQLNRLAWLLPELVKLEASPHATPNRKPAFPTEADMDLLRRVTRFLKPEG